MGKKSNYFRHSLDAHSDPKIMRAIQIGGVKILGVYWIIVELYGRALINDDEQKRTQEINARLIANATGLRSDSCRTAIGVLSDCNLIDAVWLKFKISSVQVSIPNFSKYFGRYEKTEKVECPNKNKTKQNKTKQIKTKQTTPEFDFEALYKKYPQKKGKQTGISKCIAQIKTKERYDQLETAINNYSRECEQKGTSKNYIKHFSSFMKDWEDYIEMEQTAEEKMKEILEGNYVEEQQGT